ncbi:hypothetical protein MPER_08449 [Moniliophthora perniciosa FA553]|nr:hypothetical protein MPER_08449 [Moniliophthora perniciosa FA553]
MSSITHPLIIKAFEGIPVLRRDKVSNSMAPRFKDVPAHEWHNTLFTLSRIANIHRGCWVTIGKGLYRGDLGLVINDAPNKSTSQRYVRLLVVPRVDLSAMKENASNKRKGKAKATSTTETTRIRPSAAMVDLDDMLRHGYELGKDFRVWCGCNPNYNRAGKAVPVHEDPLKCDQRYLCAFRRTFTFGFEVRELAVTVLSTPSVCPSEVEHFWYTSPATFVQAALDGMPPSDTWDFQRGEKVQAVEYCINPDARRTVDTLSREMAVRMRTREHRGPWDPEKESEVGHQRREWADSVADTISTRLFNEEARHQYLSTTGPAPGLLREGELDPTEYPSPNTYRDPWFFSLQRTFQSLTWASIKAWEKDGKLAPPEEPIQTIAVPHRAIGGDAMGEIRGHWRGRLVVHFGSNLVVEVCPRILQKVFSPGRRCSIKRHNIQGD